MLDLATAVQYVCAQHSLPGRPYSVSLALLKSLGIPPLTLRRSAGVGLGIAVILADI
jgi:hypothetical protein